MAPKLPKEGELIELELSDLRPDTRNPRLPPSRQGSFPDDEEIYRFIDREYDAYHIADSIQRHGYFLAEPLIAMPSEDGVGWTVLEGNRRLTALKGLSDLARRANYPDRRWKGVPAKVKLPAKYTVFAVPTRAQIAPVLGFRHITGIAEWEPYAQARYVAQLVDEEGHSLRDVVNLIGRKPTEVNSAYRNYWIVEQARDKFKVKDVARVLDEFGVWTRAMGNPALRDFIGAPSPRDVNPEYWPINDSKASEVGRLFDWLFGSPRSNTGDQESAAVIAESREITRLGRVVASERGRQALERGWDMSAAERAMEDPADAFVARLVEARDSLLEVVSSRPGGEVPIKAVALLAECVELLDQIREREHDRSTA